jgi:capping protein (actin filament) muscle Z-line, beta
MPSSTPPCKLPSPQTIPTLTHISRDLLRRLSPTNISDSLTALTTLLPKLTEDLLSSVDQPLQIARDPTSSRDYLLCDYNRDSDSYRSPWSNEFHPPLPTHLAADASFPSERVRKLEVEVNTAFDVYRQMYYETGGISSVYLWDLDEGFAGVVLLKKTIGSSKSSAGAEAGWDSIHVFEVDERRAAGAGGGSGKSAAYKLTSTVILHLNHNSGNKEDTMSLAGSMTRQLESTLALTPSGGALGTDSSHVVNIGKLVEDMEGKMRNLLQEVYFGKAKDVVGDLRSVQGLTGVNKERATQREVIGSVGGGKQGESVV